MNTFARRKITTHNNPMNNERERQASQDIRKEGIIECGIPEIADYINWIYFFHTWKISPRFASVARIHRCGSCLTAWLNSFPESERAEAQEAYKLYEDARKELNREIPLVKARFIYKLFSANSRDEDIIIDGKFTIPFLRQQEPTSPNGSCLCLADYIRPAEQGIADTLGAFGATADCTPALTGDEYTDLLARTLSERLAEAIIEKEHARIRKTIWGYAPHEDLPMSDLLAERYEGIRPAAGYPSIPDQSIIFLLDELLDLGKIGIRITENGAMQPPASVCGFLFAHKQARYFSVGSISREQYLDYARRRGISPQTLRKFLSNNIVNP